MKQIKIVLTMLLAIAIGLSSSSFVSKVNYQKNQNTYYYSTITKLFDSSPYTQITTNQALSIVPTELNDQAYWSNGSVGLHGCSDNLKGIQYNSSVLTFQQAIQVVKNYYSIWGTLPNDGDSIYGFWGLNIYQIIIWREPAD